MQVELSWGAGFIQKSLADYDWLSHLIENEIKQHLEEKIRKTIRLLVKNGTLRYSVVKFLEWYDAIKCHMWLPTSSVQ